MSTPGHESRHVIPKPSAAPTQPASPIYRVERVIASVTVGWVVILTTYMLFQDHALSHTSIYFLKIILSLSGAVMLATLPGFFDINYTLGGFSVRAAGGAAAFVFIYTQSPHLPSMNANVDNRPSVRQETQEPRQADTLSSAQTGPSKAIGLWLSPSMSAPSSGGQSGSAASGEASLGMDNGSAGWEAQLDRTSFGEAVQSDLYSAAATIAAYAMEAFNALKSWLDYAASALRSAVDHILGVARDLLGLETASNKKAETIGVVTEDVSRTLDGATDTVMDRVNHSVNSFFAGLSDVTSSVFDGVSNAVGGLIGTTDRTVGTLSDELENTKGKVLGGTEKAVHGTTELLDKTTGRLTSGATKPVEDLASNVTDKADQTTGTVLSKTSETASGVLAKVDSGFSSITKQLNAVTPAIVSHLDPAFAAAADGRKNTHATAVGALGNVAGRVRDTLDPEAMDRLLDDHLVSIDKDSRGLGRLPDPADLPRFAPDTETGAASGPTCISGCSDAPARGLGRCGAGDADRRGRSCSDAPARGLGRRLGVTVTGTLGPLGSGSGGGSGPGGGYARPPSSGPSGANGGGGGPVSSTLKSTGAAVGGALKTLKKH